MYPERGSSAWVVRFVAHAFSGEQAWTVLRLEYSWSARLLVGLLLDLLVGLLLDLPVGCPKMCLVLRALLLRRFPGMLAIPELFLP